jgi:hypothetical protein
VRIVLVHPDVSQERLESGLAAAVQVFRYEAVDPKEAYQALVSEEAWIDSGHDERYALSAAEMRALNALLCAEAAANGVLGCAGKQEPARLEFEER